jgi:hypothetical protein
MKELIYNEKWIVCGHTPEVEQSQLKNAFENIKPDERAVILVNNHETLSVYAKNAFTMASMILLAALKSGAIQFPFSNADFCVIMKDAGLVLLPNVAPFNRIIQRYHQGEQIFSEASIEMVFFKTPVGEIPKSICPF